MKGEEWRLLLSLLSKFDKLSTFLTLQDKHKIRTLSLNMKFICTSFRNRQNSEPSVTHDRSMEFSVYLDFQLFTLPFFFYQYSMFSMHCFLYLYLEVVIVHSSSIHFFCQVLVGIGYGCKETWASIQHYITVFQLKHTTVCVLLDISESKQIWLG
jgi:hypothetical protein